MSNRGQLIAAFLRYGETESEDLFWAWNDVTDIVMRRPDEAWPLIMDLIHTAIDDDALMYVAAGPLEDFLWKHGDAFIDEIVQAAETDDRVREALEGVWGKNHMATRVWQELERVLR